MAGVSFKNNPIQDTTMKFLKSTLILLFIPFAVTAGTDKPAEKTEYVIDNDRSTMTIKGGSTVGSWDADVTTIEAAFTVDMEALEEGRSDEAFLLSGFSIPVEDIISGGSRMTKNIHKYLDKKNHPQIHFTLEETNITSEPDSDGKRFTISSNGTINAAGADNDVTLNLTAELLEDGSIVFSGVQNIAFSEYGIDRPSAMLGTVKAKEEMEVHYTLYLVKN